MKPFTVGDLKAALADLPDELEVQLFSDTGVGEIVAVPAQKVLYDSRFERFEICVEDIGEYNER